MTENKCRWTIQLESAYYHFCIESIKKNTPIYEPQHQTTEHYCIQTALTHYAILVHATIVWKRHCTQPAFFIWVLKQPTPKLTSIHWCTICFKQCKFYTQRRIRVTADNFLALSYKDRVCLKTSSSSIREGTIVWPRYLYFLVYGKEDPLRWKLVLDSVNILIIVNLKTSV